MKSYVMLLMACSTLLILGGCQLLTQEATAPGTTEESAVMVEESFSEPVMEGSVSESVMVETSSSQSLGQPCAGITGALCPKGQICVDDPNDGCDPIVNGADCSGNCEDE